MQFMQHIYTIKYKKILEIMNYDTRTFCILLSPSAFLGGRKKKRKDNNMSYKMLTLLFLLHSKVSFL